MKINSKALAPIITLIMILGVTLIAYVSLNQWYSGITSDIEAKMYQEIGNLGEKFEVLGIKEEGVNYVLYVKSNSYGYMIINSLKLNGNLCTLPSSNVIVGKKINKININCPLILSNNDLFIQSTSDSINTRVNLVS